MGIKLALQKQYFKKNILLYLHWDWNKYPHACIFGSTGSGKTFFLKIIIARLLKEYPDCYPIICDFKGDNDFEFLASFPNFYRFTDCQEGLHQALRILHARQSGDPTRSPVLFVFDEWASFINSCDKKAAEENKKILSLLLMQARSFGIHVMISQQRMDAEYFKSCRDCFSLVIAMGYLSKEAIHMMLPDHKDLIQNNKSRGEGHVLMGSQLYEILVLPVRDISLVQGIIRSGFCPQDGDWQGGKAPDAGHPPP